MELSIGYSFEANELGEKDRTDGVFTVYELFYPYGNRSSTYEIGDEQYALQQILRYFDLK